MFPGISKITKKTKVDRSFCDLLIRHPYYTTLDFKDQIHFITDGEAKDVFEQAILDFLKSQELEFKGKKIEFWFQEQSNGNGLVPHCDYNFYARNAPGFIPFEWLGTHKEEYFLSPITLSIYLEVSDDMEGGELCISEKSWMDYSKFEITKEELLQEPYEIYNPIQNEVLYFNGSMYFHWIEPVTKGRRKSVLINFWPLGLGDDVPD